MNSCQVIQTKDVILISITCLFRYIVKLPQLPVYLKWDRGKFRLPLLFFLGTKKKWKIYVSLIDVEKSSPMVRKNLGVAADQELALNFRNVRSISHANGLCLSRLNSLRRTCYVNRSAWLRKKKSLAIKNTNVQLNGFVQQFNIFVLDEESTTIYNIIIHGSIYRGTSKPGKNSLLNSTSRKLATSGWSKASFITAITVAVPTISRWSHVVERDVIRTDWIVPCLRLASRATKVTVKLVKVAVAF